MKKNWQKIIHVLLVIAIFCISCLPFGLGKSEGIEIDSSASSWAVPELQQAYDYGLTYPDIMRDFNRLITREEFCTIVVKLYQKLTNQTVTANSNPFSDTTNPEVIKAYQLGIVKGTGQGQFSPDLFITRQEICVMIFNALDKSNSTLDKNTDGPFPFADQNQIAEWALNAMKFAYKNQIMKGVGDKQIDPLNNTTREQAIALLKRTFEAFRPNGGSGTEPGQPGAQTGSNATVLIDEPSPPIVSEKEKFMKLDFTNRLTNPKYDTHLELFAATGPGKPGQDPAFSSSLAVPPNQAKVLLASAALPTINSNLLTKPLVQPNTNLQVPSSSFPVLPKIPQLPGLAGPVYSKADFAAFIDQNGDRKRWFSFNLKSAPGAAKVVWQVSKTPFTGFKDNWQNPPGLVKSGEASPPSGEFSIDFAAFAPGPQNGGGIWNLKLKNWWNHNSYQEIPTPQRKYYVRAVPVDAGGNCIGDPGEGLAVLYGKPQTAPTVARKSVAASFELWTTRRNLEPSNKGQGGEFPNNLEHLQSITYSPDETMPHWFQFKEFDTAATQIVMQVSTKSFTGLAANWEAPPGLVYSKSYSLPISLTNYGQNIVPIPFKDFGLPKDSLKPKEYVPYYVRAAAVKPSTTPGCVNVDFSETITVQYGYEEPQKILEPQKVKVNSYLPQVKIKHYQPVDWEDSDWADHYYVYRAPSWNEINCKFQNSQTQTTLYPWYHYSMAPTPDFQQQYEQQIIPQVLKPGTKVHIKHQSDQDKSLWEDLWDDIKSFFEHIIDLIAKLVNWASQAYASIKQGLINFVANAFPVESWRDELKKALTVLVDTGLAAMGIPPELPNFDQLTSMSLEYMAEVALTEAGVPTEDIIAKNLVNKTAESLGKEMENAAKKATPNPIDAPFLKADPQYLYQPAYIEVEISNPYIDKPTLPGTLNIDVEWPWQYSDDLYNKIMAAMPSSASGEYEVGSNWGQVAYANHFFFGLSGVPSDYLYGATYIPEIYYPIFKPVRDMKVPPLQPGEHRTVRIYLEEYVGKPYPFAANGETVRKGDFSQLYWGTCGQAHFDVWTGGNDLPDPRTAALAENFVEESGKIYEYYYDGYGSCSFQHVPGQPYTP